MSNRHRSSKQDAPGATHQAPNKEQRRAENRKIRHRTHELLAHADAEVGEEITRAVQIPTIGIGAGAATDAQVLVIHDLLGINETMPKLARRYADLRAEMTGAVRAFVHDVETGTFPDDEHSYS